jgi:aspartate/tyrosine/aromatic aminotransferase
MAPPDPILGTTIAFRKDTSPDKVNLGVGAYRDDNGKPYIFPAVAEAERRIAADASLNHEYLGIDGLESFCSLSRGLILGDDCPAIAENRVVSCQALSGTGALRLGAEFISWFLKEQTPAVLVSNPTWGNHLTLFRKQGLNVVEYPYFHPPTRGLDFEGMMNSLRAAAANSVVLLHACAHNPTGVDPTPAQWDQIAEVMAERDLVPFFDSAYQGFATGDFENDAYAIRSFARRGFQMFISQSFAKNIGLYGERIGCFHIVCSNAETANIVRSQVMMVVRPMYSSPPCHGAFIVQKILSDPELRAGWINELKAVSQRIIDMRAALVRELTTLGAPGDWSHITKQIGMFSYTGLTPAQCDVMINKWHCYMLRNGRISMSGVNSHNVNYLARAIMDAAAS